MNQIGYFMVLGRVINQAIKDCRKPKFSKMRNKSYIKSQILNWEDAKSFIFTDRLSAFLEYYQLQDILNAEYIRKQAEQYMKGKEIFSDQGGADEPKKTS